MEDVPGNNAPIRGIENMGEIGKDALLQHIGQPDDIDRMERDMRAAAEINAAFSPDYDPDAPDQAKEKVLAPQDLPYSQN